MRYAAKVKRDKGSTIMSLREQQNAEKKFGKYESKSLEKITLTGKQKVTLILFALTFVIMIIGFIPWGEFNITIFDKFTGWLTGASLGKWWFYESALWFLIMSIIIAIINKFGFKVLEEKENLRREIYTKSPENINQYVDIDSKAIEDFEEAFTYAIKNCHNKNLYILVNYTALYPAHVFLKKLERR